MIKMWIIALHIFLCFITQGLWLIPLAIYYLIKLFGGSIKFLDSWLPQKFTPNGKTKSFSFNPVEDYIDFNCDVKLSDYDASSNGFSAAIIHITSKPKDMYNLFSNVEVTIRVQVNLILPNSNDIIPNYFDVTVYPNDNGVCDYEELVYLSIKAKGIDSVEMSKSSSNGRVTIPPKAKKENSIKKEEESNVVINKEESTKYYEIVEEEPQETIKNNIQEENSDANRNNNVNNDSFSNKIMNETELIKAQTAAIYEQIEALKKKQELEAQLKDKDNKKKTTKKTIKK